MADPSLMIFRRNPLQLTLLYLSIASLWILFSDALLLALGLDRDALAHYQSLKGFLFVLVSGLALYCALAQHWREQHLARTALKGSEERLALALDSAQEGMWDWDMKSNRVFYSRRFCEMLGYSPEDFGTDREAWLSRLHPEDRHLAEERLRALVDDRPPYYEGTFRLRHRNGDYRWLYARGQLLLDEGGEPSRFIGTSSDITQRRADEESLRQAAVVFDSTLEGVLVTDRELKIVHVNPAFSRITGYSSDEVLGKSPNMFKSGHHDPDFYRSLWHALEQRGSWSGEI